MQQCIEMAQAPITPAISGLEALIQNLQPEQRELVQKIFRVRTSIGEQRIPESMRELVERQSGVSLEEVEGQEVVRVDNLVALHTALFNLLRSKRPKNGGGVSSTASGYDPLANLSTDTPEDVFGRVAGKSSRTASNLYRYDASNSMVVLENSDYLNLSREELTDALVTAQEWITRMHAINSSAEYPLIMWNAGPKAGASLLHTHKHVMLAQGEHYMGIERLKRDANAYSQQHVTSYFDDLYLAHEALGLGFKHEGNMVFAQLAPVKEAESWIVRWPSLEEGFSIEQIAGTVYHVVEGMVKGFGVENFNMAIYLPAINRENGWSAFPLIARFVDRGSSKTLTSDFGAMEALGVASVISTDPFSVAEVLKQRAESSHQYSLHQQ
jgi:hypothetical protein